MEKMDFNLINAVIKEYLEFHEMKETLEAFEQDERLKQQKAGPQNALVKRGGVIQGFQMNQLPTVS